jgi:hypothetical protein
MAWPTIERMSEALTTHKSSIERNKMLWENLANGNITQALLELGLTLGELIERVEKLEKR